MSDLAESTPDRRVIEEHVAWLRELIRSTAMTYPCFPEFIAKLSKEGVEFVCRLTQTGRISAIAFETQFAGEIKASILGSEFTWTGLQRKLGIEYVKIRDFHLLASHARSAERAVKHKKSRTGNADNNELLGALARIESLEERILSLLDEQQRLGLNQKSMHSESLPSQGMSNVQDIMNETRDDIQRVDNAVRRIEAFAQELSKEGLVSVRASRQHEPHRSELPEHLREELRFHLEQIKSVSQNTLVTTNKLLQRTEAAVSRMRQESFWLAFVVALTAGLVSALVTGLWVAQETEKRFQAQQQALVQHLDETAQNDPLRIYFQKLMDSLP